MLDISVELYYDSSWHDLVMNDDVLASNEISITRGDGDESAALRPSTITLRLNNVSDNYRLSNPASPFYKKITKNTKAKVSVNGIVRGFGELSSWTYGQSSSYNKINGTGSSWVDIEISGILQRIGQWTQPLSSPLTRSVSSISSLVGFWPLEDGKDSTELTQVCPSAKIGYIYGDVSLAENDNPKGCSASVKINASGATVGGFFAPTTASGYQVSFASKLDTAPSTSTFLDLFTFYDSTGRIWKWQVNNADYRLYITESDGTLLKSSTFSYSTSNPTEWNRYRLKVTISGTTISFDAVWLQESGGPVFGVSDSFTGASTGRLLRWEVIGNSYNINAHYVSVLGITDTTLDLLGAATAVAFNGYNGESTTTRLDRILTEYGFGVNILGDDTKAPSMGIQYSDTLLNLLKEIRDTEDSLIFDSRTDLTLDYKMLNYRYNNTPITIYDYELSFAPLEIDDDSNVHNTITIQQREGSAFTVSDNTSELSTQNPPDGVGVYQQTVNVNSRDSVFTLEQLAHWWLNKGTIDEPKYPSLTINIGVLSNERIAEIESIDVGSVISVVDYRENSLDLFVLGYTENIGWPSNRTITLTCLPNNVYSLGTYDTALYGIATATVTNDVQIGSTTINFTITNDEAFSTTASFDLLISGERIGVSAGGFGARSGTLGAYSQTLTNAVRAKNGIIKAIPAGSNVYIINTGRWGL